jgi:hypothetical protein
LETKVVNLFGGPGTGKSTIAAGIFSELKWQGVEAELVTEFAKDLVWAGHIDSLQNQLRVSGEQLERVRRLIGKVEVVVTDSPILLGVYYGDSLGDDYKRSIVKYHEVFDNLNYFLQRTKPYHKNGRLQSEDEAKQVDESLLKILTTYNIPYKTMLGTRIGQACLVEEILLQLGRNI